MTKKSNNQQSSEAENTATATGAGTIKPAIRKFNVVMDNSTSALQLANVTARKVEAGDMLTAQRISGANEGNAFTLAIIAQVCTFDGKKLTYEDLQHLPFEDFLELQSQLMDLAWMGSKELLSSFVEKYT